MQRLRASFTAPLWLLTICCIAVSEINAAQPVDAIPDSAAAVLRWKSPQTSLEKLADFVDEVQPGIGPAVREALPQLGNLLGNPGLKGIDVEQDIWVIGFAEPQSPPSIVVVTIAKDVDDLKDSLPVSLHIHADGNLVAISHDEEALEFIRQRLSGESKPLWQKIDAASRKLFDAGDVSVLVNVRQLTEDFASELKNAEPALDALIEQITNSLPDAQRPQIEPALEIYRALGRVILHGINDTNSLTLGFTFTPTAIRFEDRLQVANGSSTAKFLASQKPGTLSVLSNMPADMAIYVGIKAELSKMMEWSMSFARNMLPNATDEQAKQFSEAVKEMGQVKYEEMAMFFGVNEESPVIRAGSVSIVSPTAKLREISNKLTEVMSEIKTPFFTQTTVVDSAIEKIGDGTVDRVTVRQEFNEDADAEGTQKKLLTAMFGEEGIQQYVLYQPRRVLQTMGGGLAELKNLAAALDAKKPTASAATAARSRLLEQANVVVLLDVAQLLSTGFIVGAQQGVLPIDGQAIRDLKLEPSYIGYGLSCEATAVRTQWEIPVRQVQNIAKVIQLLNQGR